MLTVFINICESVLLDKPEQTILTLNEDATLDGTISSSI